MKILSFLVVFAAVTLPSAVMAGPIGECAYVCGAVVSLQGCGYVGEWGCRIPSPFFFFLDINLKSSHQCMFKDFTCYSFYSR